MNKRINTLDHFFVIEGETANTERRSLRVIDPRTIPTPRADAIRLRRLACDAERAGRTLDAALLRTLEAAAEATVTRRVSEIREALK